jgi:outer membrane protein assembly factor BamB
VIPSLLGPLQGLIAILPQILLLVAAGFAALFSLKWWRMRFSRLVSARPRTKIIIGTVIFIVVGGSITVLLFSGRWTTGRYEALPVAGRNLQTSGQTWPAFRGGLTRIGNTDQQPGPQIGEEVWVFRDHDFRSGNFSSSPAVIGNRVYIGSAQADVFSMGGAVYCLDTASGEMIWRYQTKREIFSSPAVVDGKVYIGEGLHSDVDSELYCLDAATGSLLWSFQTTSHVESSPTVVDGRVFFGGGANGVYCADAKTGEQIWVSSGLYVSVSPAVYDGNVYVGTGYGETGIYCLDADTGEQKWKLPMDYPVWSSPSLSSGRAYFGVGNGNFLESDENPYGKVVCVDTNTSEIIWEYEVGDSVLTAVAFSDGRVYFGSRDGNVYCLDADSGELEWEWATEAPVVSSPAVAGEYVYFGSDNGIIYCLGKSNGQLGWEFDTTITAPDGTKILSSPAVANNKVYVGSSKFYFFCIGQWEPEQS